MSLVDSERAAGIAISKELEAYLDAVDAAYKAMGMVMEAVPEQLLEATPLARRVTSMLLARLANDMRCSSLLVMHGYGVQAASIISSAYEVACSIVYIGSDEDRAQRWVNHSSRTSPFMGAKPLTEAVVRECSPESDYRSVYEKYSDLCMAKHANPILQMWFGVSVDFESKTVHIGDNGPDCSEVGLQVAALALENAAGLGHMAATSFMKHWVSEEKRAGLLPVIEEAGARYHAANAASIERWGKRDGGSLSAGS